MFQAKKEAKSTSSLASAEVQRGIGRLAEKMSAERFKDTHPGSQIYLRDQNYRLLEQTRGKIQQKNRISQSNSN